MVGRAHFEGNRFDPMRVLFDPPYFFLKLELNRWLVNWTRKGAHVGNSHHRIPPSTRATHIDR